MRNTVDNLSAMCMLISFATTPPGPCAAANVSVAPRSTSSLTPITGFFYGSLWKGNRHFTSITGEWSSLFFLPFPLKKSQSQIVAAASSFAGVLGLMDYIATLTAIRRPTNGMYYRVASILLVRLA